MRKFPTESAEVVSQAYYSEEVKVINENSHWIKIETTVDRYPGWIKAGGICERKVKFPTDSIGKVAKVNRCMAHLYNVPDTTFGPILTLPFESLLEVIDQGDDINSRWIKVALADQKEGYIQRGDITLHIDMLEHAQLPSLSLRFQGLPYTWGGRSSFGYDCSGFVQMLYRQTGVYLPRDAKDQAKWEGFKSTSIHSLLPGDLIFFGLDEAKIRHVGMYLSEGQFIHSTVAENAPYIHISTLTDHEWSDAGKWAYRTARTLYKPPQSPQMAQRGFYEFCTS